MDCRHRLCTYHDLFRRLKRRKYQNIKVTKYQNIKCKPAQMKDECNWKCFPRRVSLSFTSHGWCGTIGNSTRFKITWYLPSFPNVSLPEDSNRYIYRNHCGIDAIKIRLFYPIRWQSMVQHHQIYRLGLANKRYWRFQLLRLVQWGIVKLYHCAARQHNIPDGLQSRALVGLGEGRSHLRIFILEREKKEVFRISQFFATFVRIFNTFFI